MGGCTSESTRSVRTGMGKTTESAGNAVSGCMAATMSDAGANAWTESTAARDLLPLLDLGWEPLLAWELPLALLWRDSCPLPFLLSYLRLSRTGCTIVSTRSHSSLTFLIPLFPPWTFTTQHNTTCTISPRSTTNQENAGNPHHHIDHGFFNGVVFHSPNFILTTRRGFGSFISQPFHHLLISSHSQQQY